MANLAMENVKLKVKYVMLNKEKGCVEEINPKCLFRADCYFEGKTHDQELLDYHENLAKVALLNHINSTDGTNSRLLNTLKANKVKELKEKMILKEPEKPSDTSELPVDEVVAFINGDDGKRYIKGTKRNKKKKNKNKSKKNKEASTSEDPMTTENDLDPAIIEAIDREVEQFEKVLKLSRSERIEMLYKEGASGK